ncbi:MAG: Ni/Fe hydrogenase subunit alpha [Candidatus Eisenbacteria bacterium]|nr:Ni/Fe hydrogenase subunit alpha [Candidatus Latescibacterota bacterium]MBD3301040.1 Ni/Fe hydrogenase subunit alpha [Candidatus Eisenbacteria bacterium]
MKGYEINVHHITRIEGHGNLVVNVKDGHIEELRLEIVESPRFFEAMLEGRRYDEAPWITARICGICALGHTTASILAAEDALGIEPDEETVLLRKLLVDGETLQSHILHLYFLVAPDFFNAGSVIPLAETHPEVVKRALRLKKMANASVETLVGRKVHPIGMMPGGFRRWPLPEEIGEVKRLLLEAREDLTATVELFRRLDMPPLRRDETEYLALREDGEYALYTGQIASSLGTISPPRTYRDRIHETVAPHSSAKHVSAERDSFAVGALARYNLNHDRLRPWAKAVAAELGLEPPVTNPFHNNTAQLVEILHCYEDALELCDQLLERPNGDHRIQEPTRHGRGVGASEVPRGTLYHDYRIDESGRITEANCIIPTGQNLANIEADMRQVVSDMAGGEPNDIQQRLEMLVRAYDPCISCSCHFLDVEFV